MHLHIFIYGRSQILWLTPDWKILHLIEKLAGVCGLQLHRLDLGNIYIAGNSLNGWLII